MERTVRSRQRHGHGAAAASPFALKAAISPTTSVAIINVGADGSADALHVGTVDMGQGSDTGMAQIVGEVLNIPAEKVRVVPRDTDVTPYDMGTLGSRSLFHMGHAVRLAAEEVRDKIAALAPRGRRAGGQQHADRRAVQEKIRHAGRQHHRHAALTSPITSPPDHDTGASTSITPFWMVAGTGVEVEVDTETGHMRILKLINVGRLRHG